MKERDFRTGTEHSATASPGRVRGATALKPTRLEKTGNVDVDGLVSGFLDQLDTISVAGDITAGEMHGERQTETARTAASSQSAVDIELELTLREIEARPKLSVIPAAAREIAATQPAAMRSMEPTAAPEPAATQSIPIKATGIGGGKELGKVSPVAPKKRVIEEPSEAGEPLDFRLLLTPPKRSPGPGRKVAIGFAAVILIGACVIFAYLSKNTPAPNRVAVTAAPAAVSAGADAQQTSENSVPSKGDKPTADAPPPPAARASNPKPTTTGPSLISVNNGARTKPASPVQNPGSQPKSLEGNAAGQPKQPSLPATDLPGSGVVTAPPAGQNSEVQAPASSRLVAPPPSKAGSDTSTVEPPKTAASAQPPVGRDSVTANPPVEPPKTSASAQLPAGRDPVTVNPAEETNTKGIPPAPKTEPVPIATSAVPIFKPAPIYPLTAARSRAEGTVEVRVAVDEQGKVTKATAISGELVLRPAAEDALKKWKFTPATLRGKNVASEIVVSVRFVR